MVGSVVLKITYKVKPKYFKQNRTDENGFVIVVMLLANAFWTNIDIFIVFDL